MKKQFFVVLLLSLTCVFAAPANPGDVDGSGVVDVSDLIIILSDKAGVYNSRSDSNNDGVIDLFDLVLAAKHYGTTYAGSGLPTGLIASYPFEEGSGTTTADKTGTYPSLAFNGNPTWTTSGKYGRAINFDGIGDYLYANPTDKTGPSTITLWVKPTLASQPENTGLFSTTNDWTVPSSFQIEFGGASTCPNQFNFFATTATSTQFSVCYASTSTAWTHIAVTFDGTTVRTYHDGVLRNAATQSFNAYIDLLKIGINRGSNVAFNGVIDEVRIYNRALSAQEINTDRTLNSTGQTPPACVPTTCQAQGANCGSINDGCSSTLNCGTCSGTDVCQVNTCVPAPPQGPSNEPAGFTQIFLTDGSDKYFGATNVVACGTPGDMCSGNWFFGSKWNDNTKIQVIPDGAAPFGSVVEKRFFINDTDGWHGIASLGSWGQDYNEVYFRWTVKYSSNYQVHAAGEKHFYWGLADGPSPTEFYILMQPNRQIGIHNQAPNAGFVQPLSSHVLPLGQYVTYELHAVAESTPGVSDGSYTLWADGVKVLEDTTVSWITAGTPGFNGAQVYDYWGGGTNAKTVNDNVRIAEFYASGKNSVQAASFTPNEPTGMTMTTNTAFSVPSDLSWIGNKGSESGFTDATAPYSPDKVVRFVYPGGSNGTGFGTGIVANQVPPGTVKVYIAYNWKLSPVFTIHSSTFKQWYFWRDISSGLSGSFVPGFITNDPNLDTGSFWFIGQAQTGQSNIFTNVAGAPTLTRNKWTHTEILTTMNTAPGVADGKLQVWFDGILSVNRSDIIWSPAGQPLEWRRVNFDPYWGGNDPSIWVAQDSYLYVDHAYISASATR